MSSRHQLVVLGIISGSNFPPGSGQLIVRGQLGGVWLASEAVPASASPSLGEQQLVWEVTVAQLRQCRSRKVMLRVEVWRDKEMLGHLVMDLRTAVPLHTKNDEAPVRGYRLIGSGATLELSLGLEEVETIVHNISEEEMETGQSSRGVSPSTQVSLLSPVLMENEDGSGGYFLIGDESVCHQKFSLSICLVCAENLHLVPAKGLVLQQKDPFYFQYDLLGVDISTEQFFRLEKPEFVSEKATAMIISNEDIIRQFLSNAGVSIRLCHGATVLAAAEVELGCVLPDGGQLEDRMTYQGKVDMVAAHNLSVPQDGEGNQARIGVMVVLMREEMNLSTGRLSDSEMEADDGVTININNNQDKDQKIEKASLLNSIYKDTAPGKDTETNNVETINSPTDQDQQLPPPTSQLSPRPDSPPTKLYQAGQAISQPQVLPMPSKLPQPTLIPAKLPQPIPSPSTPLFHPTPTHPLPEDTNDYLSPPPPPTKSYKLSVELKTISLTDPSVSYTDSVMAYKYLALHKEVITTPAFSIEGDKMISVPGGYCQFSFAVQEAKMKKTFSGHLLKVGMYVGGQMRGRASVNLLEVVGGGRWSGQVDMVGSEGVIGQVEVELELRQGDKVKEKDFHTVDKVRKEHEVQTGDMLAMAARELEAWKTDQKKKFNDSLVQVEVQHLTLLGKEWREREKERERVVQEKMETLKVLEQELRQELEKMEVQKREMEERQMRVEIEQDKVEREKFALKNEKVVLVESLRQQLREKDAEVAVKASEIDILTKKLDGARLDADKRILEKNTKGQMDTEMKAELAQMRAEKTTWIASMEQAAKEKRFYMENCEQLRKEVVQLQVQKEKTYTDQIAGLEKQVKELSSKLVDERELPSHTKNIPVQTDPAKNVETQTPHVQPTSRVSTPQQSDRIKEMVAGLARLEDNLDMLLRTGVYRETDHVVVKVKEQIEKLREKLRVERGL